MGNNIAHNIDLHSRSYLDKSKYFIGTSLFKIDLPFLRVLISRDDLFPQIRQLRLGELFKCADDSLESLHFPHYGVIGDLSMLKC